MYVVYKDLQTQFGEAEMLALCDDGTGAIDEERLSDAIEQACSEADSYLGKRYALPIEPVPPIVRCVVCDIVRYRLTSAEALETSLIVQRYQQAVLWLRGVAQGTIVLPLPTVNDDERTVDIDVGKRVWKINGLSNKGTRLDNLPSTLGVS